MDLWRSNLTSIYDEKDCGINYLCPLSAEGPSPIILLTVPLFLSAKVLSFITRIKHGTVICHHRRRVNTEEKAKVVADAWDTELIYFSAALAILHQDGLKKRINRITASWRNRCFEIMDYQPVHITPNHKMFVLPRTFLQIILAANGCCSSDDLSLPPLCILLWYQFYPSAQLVNSVVILDPVVTFKQTGLWWVSFIINFLLLWFLPTFVVHFPQKTHNGWNQFRQTNYDPMRDPNQQEMLLKGKKILNWLFFTFIFISPQTLKFHTGCEPE